MVVTLDAFRIAVMLGGAIFQKTKVRKDLLEHEIGRIFTPP